MKGVVEHQAEAPALLLRAGDAVVVMRGRPRSLVISCPCGCGVLHPINLDDRSGPAWRLYSTKESQVSLFPSVWRTEGCKSHYIIWHGRVLLFDGRGGDRIEPPIKVDIQRRAKLMAALTRKFQTLLAIADDVGEIPWDTLDALRILKAEGLIEEGRESRESQFRLR